MTALQTPTATPRACRSAAHPKPSAVPVDLRSPFAATSAALLALFAAREARAAGTGLDVQSGRGTGMAAAVTAMIDDSSAIYYNPAGIAQGKTFDAQIGDSLIIPSYQFKGRTGVTTKNSFQVVPPFQVYASGGVTRDLSIGVGVFAPFGSAIRWPDDWPGNRQIISSMLDIYDINPTVAYRFGPIRIGAGLQIVRGTVDLKKKVNMGSQVASTELGAGAWGVGANVGVQVELLKQYLSLGAHYRSAVKLDFDGNAHFDNVPPELQSTFYDQTASTTLITPDTFALAVASRPVKALVLDAEVVWFGWSKFRSIDITFPNETLLNTSQAKNWTNTVNYRIGGEINIDDSWRVRAGVLYDPSPSPDSTLTPEIPDTDRLNLAVGGTYAHPSGVHVDLGYQFIVLFKRTSTAIQFPGEYSGIANVIGISVGYRTPAQTVASNTAPAVAPVDATPPPPAPLPPVPSPEFAPPAAPLPPPAAPPLPPSPPVPQTTTGTPPVAPPN